MTVRRGLNFARIHVAACEALLQRCWRVGILREFGAKGFRFHVGSGSCRHIVLYQGLRHFPLQVGTFTAKRALKTHGKSGPAPDFCAKHFSKTLLNKSYRVFLV